MLDQLNIYICQVEEACVGPTKDKDKRKRTSLLNLGFPSKLIPSKVKISRIIKLFLFLFSIKIST